MSLGEQIAHMRKSKNIKSGELAAVIGVKQPYISAIENGRKTLSVDLLQKIASALGTTSSELLGESSPQLSFEMKRLVDTAKFLDKDMLDGLIGVLEDLTSGYRKH
jgi:transcriptional regulator with XRE-family HTH domain